MVNVGLGYYVHGDSVFWMGKEPPLEQFIFRDGAWQPLHDGFYLIHKIITGDVDTDGPFEDPPAGVPAAPVLAMR
jgi:hypothetical protein